MNSSTQPKVAIYVRTGRVNHEEEKQQALFVLSRLKSRFPIQKADVIIGYEFLIKTIESGAYDSIYAKSTDRYTRDAKKLQYLVKKAVEHNVKIYETMAFKDLTASENPYVQFSSTTN